MGRGPRARQNARTVLGVFSACVCSYMWANVGVAEAAPIQSQTQTMSRDEAEKLFVHGGEVFRQGLAKAKADYPAAEALFLEAASAWRSVASARDVQNVKLETNIGNASLLGGDVPRAVAAYRRALAIEPGDEAAKAGLAAARRAAGTQTLSGGGGSGSADTAASPTKAGDAQDGGVRGTLRQVGGVLGSAGAYAGRLLPAATLVRVAVWCYVGAFVVLIARVGGVARGAQTRAIPAASRSPHTPPPQPMHPGSSTG